MLFNDREMHVIYAHAQELSEKDALEYLKENGHAIGSSTYYKEIARIDAETNKSLFKIAKQQKQRHFMRIRKLHTIEKLMWDNLGAASPGLERVRILEKLKDMQRTISAFEEATASVISEVIRNFGKEGSSGTGEIIPPSGRQDSQREPTAKTS